MKYKTIIFDFDGVIIDSYQATVEIYQKILLTYNKSEKDYPLFRELFEADYRLSLAKLGITGKNNIQKCVQIYSDEIKKKETHLFKGISDVINIVTNNYKLAILSNTSKLIIENKLKEENLLHHFQRISGNEEGLKPDKIPYLKCLKALNSDPNETIFISDMDADLIGAKNVGISKIIGVGYGYHPINKLKDFADKIIMKPSEIINAIK